MSKNVLLDYEVANNSIQYVYNKLRNDQIRGDNQPYDFTKTQRQLNSILNNLSGYQESVMYFYPSAHRYSFARVRSGYWNKPVGFSILFNECKEIISKLIHEKYNELVVVSPDF